MDTTFETVKNKQNVLMVGIERPDNPAVVYDVKRDLERVLCPTFFKQVIVVPGLEGAYHIVR